jgi:hypothetical protein
MELDAQPPIFQTIYATLKAFLSCFAIFPFLQVETLFDYLFYNFDVVVLVKNNSTFHINCEIHNKLL